MLLQSELVSAHCAVMLSSGHFLEVETPVSCPRKGSRLSAGKLGLPLEFPRPCWLLEPIHRLRTFLLVLADIQRVCLDSGPRVPS